MITKLNNAFLTLSKRAETSAREQLVQTFVDVGPLFSILSGPDHQILYGRRGTGKTHVLNYLADKKESVGDAVVMIDLRTIGSSSGIYADGTISLAERATRLLVDTLLAVHDSLYDYFVTHAEKLDLSESGPALDALASSITTVKVVGQVEETDSQLSTKKLTDESAATLRFSKSPSFELSDKNCNSNQEHNSSTLTRSGSERLYVNFGATSSAFKRIISCLGKKRLWVLLDEWSSVPISLQPYLADLIRRTLYSVKGISVKIAAIEHRSTFMLHRDDVSYIGIEVGADASANLNLDDFMVFDNDAEKSQLFFQGLLSQHVNTIVSDTESGEMPANGADLVKIGFTEKRAFEEYVRSSEGVPRDAINLISLAAQKAYGSLISINHVREAANTWYQRDKKKVVSDHGKAQKLLDWIVDKVIGERKARAFLIQSGKSDPVIEMLFDS